MCLLIFKPADKKLPDTHLVVASDNNPHGCGIAVAMGDRIIIEKNPLWKAEQIINRLAHYEGHPAIVHFRFATHGSKNEANTHPFKLNDNWVAAHNGVISSIKTLDDESDTRAFLRQNVIPILEHGWELDQEDIIELLSQEMGSYNKMTFLRKDGVYGIANERQGHWKDGNWYSNHGYINHNHHYDWDLEDYYSHRYHGGSCSYPSPSTSGKGKVIDEQKSPLLMLPERSNNYKEVWHQMNTIATVCDCCGEDVWGPFMYEQESKMIVCKACTKWLPDSLHLPKDIKSNSFDTLSAEEAAKMMH